MIQKKGQDDMQDNLDDEFDLEDYDDDSTDDSWEDADENDSPTPDAQAKEAAPAKRQAPAGGKTFAQKNFKLIVGAVILGGGALAGLGLMSGGAPAPSQETMGADPALDPAFPVASETPDGLQPAEGLPPQPAPMESATEVLTPMPDAGAQAPQQLELAELDLGAPPEAEEAAPATPVEEIPAPDPAQIIEAPALSEVPAVPDAEPAQPAEAPEVQTQITEDIPAAEEETGFPLSLEEPEMAAPTPAQPEIVETPAPAAEQEQDNQAILEQKMAEMESRFSSVNAELTARAEKADARIAELLSVIEDLETKLRNAEATPAPAPEPVQPEVVEAPKPAPEPEATPAPPETVDVAPPAPQKAVEAAPAPAKPLNTWQLRSAQPGKAVVAAKGSDDLRTIEVGEKLAGIGRIISIGLENGKWVVRGTDGAISQ